jgi:Predicted metal-dependent protease of the PAD1/JAB1 superfamily
MIVMTREAYNLLIKACRAAYPEEACGLLVADADPGSPIDGIRPVRNAHPQPEKGYRFDPADWVRAWTETRQSRRRIAGFYHSHPHASPAPSAADLEGWQRLAGPDFTYWIVSLRRADRPETAAYRLPDGASVPAEVRIQIAERHDVARGDLL